MSRVSFIRHPVFQRLCVFLGLTVAIFVVAALHGAEQAERGVRILGSLEPLIELIRAGGKLCIDWTIAQAPLVARSAAGFAVVCVGIAFAVERGRAWPLVILAASGALIVWAQVWLWADFFPYGVWAYVGAMGLAALFGVCCPAQWRGPEPDDLDFPWWEVGVLTALCAMALATRLYALTELPSFFVGEMAVSMLGSRTLVGIARYMQEGLTGSSIGIMHLLPQMVFFEWLGTSIYSLRLVAVAFGVACVPLLYWLLRRMSGRRAAVIGAILMIIAPEQLWFSRAENTNFQAITILALVSAHLGVSMLRRFSVWTVALNALWIPWTRLFYLAGVTLMVYPGLLVAHALIFVRGTWRKLWFIVPILAGGVGLWWYSLSAANFAVSGAPWRFLNPAFHGEAVMNRDPAAHVGTAELLSRQAQSLATNLSVVITGAVYHGGFSHWYQRYDETKNLTVYNCAAIALFALAFGYLLAQFYNRFAFALLVWFGLGLLPGILSTMPVERRMSVAFSAIYAISAVGLDSFLRIAKQRGGRVAGDLATMLVVAILAAIALTSLSSHYRLPTRTLGYDTVLRFSKPIFQQSDAVFHDVDGTMAMVFGLGSADQLVRRDNSPCFQYVNPHDILQTALDPLCVHHDATFVYLISETEMNQRSAAYQPPRRVSFLLDGHANERRPVEVLRTVFPEARIGETKPDNEELDFVSVQLTREMIDARRTPLIRLRPDAAPALNRVLTGGRVQLGEALPSDSAAAVIVQGGAFIKHEGWYNFRVEPPCAAAAIRIAGHDVSNSATIVPLLRGVHPFELVLPEAHACALPLRLAGAASDGTTAGRQEPILLTDPGLEKLDVARAQTSTPLDAYGAARFVENIPRAVDVARGQDGKPLVLGYEGEQAWLYELDSDLTIRRRTRLKLPAGVLPNTILPLGRNRLAVYAIQQLLIFDDEAKLQATWDEPPVIGSHFYAALGDGRFLSPLPNHASVAVIDTSGRIAQEFRTWEGGAGSFFEPVAVALSPGGDLLVVQTNHIAHLFRNFAATLKLDYVRSFEFDLTYPSVAPRGLEFDGNGRILISDPNTNRVLMYDTEGHRLLAPTRSQDLGQRGLNEVLRIRVIGGAVYMVDGTRLAVVPKTG